MKRFLRKWLEQSKTFGRRWFGPLIWAIGMNLLFFSGFAWLSLERETIVPDRPKARAVALSQPATFPVPPKRSRVENKTKSAPKKETEPEKAEKTIPPEPVVEPPPKTQETKPPVEEKTPPKPDLSALNPEPEAKVVPPQEPEIEKEKTMGESEPEKSLAALQRAARMVPVMPASNPGQEARAGQVDKSPRLIDRVPPRYPEGAWAKGVTGSVVVRLLIDVQGSVAQISILGSDPPGVFEDSVKQAVRQWRFKPGEFRKKPVPVWVVQRVHFRLPD